MKRYVILCILMLGLLIALPSGGLLAAENEKGSDTQSSASIVHEPAYTPLPYKPVKRDANNALLGSGLGLAAVVIGGSVVLDKRKTQKGGY